MEGSDVITLPSQQRPLSPTPSTLTPSFPPCKAGEGRVNPDPGTICNGRHRLILTSFQGGLVSKHNTWNRVLQMCAIDQDERPLNGRVTNPQLV
ncbi:unnamed protein product [Boreogadus saida]